MNTAGGEPPRHLGGVGVELHCHDADREDLHLGDPLGNQPETDADFGGELGEGGMGGVAADESEIELIVSMVKRALLEGPRIKQADAA